MKDSYVIVYFLLILIQFRHESSCELLDWSRGMRTGSNTDDPVIGGDMVAMLQYAFDRNNLPFDVGNNLILVPTNQVPS